MNKHFFVVGAQRSGTTFLYHLLDGHPEIEMAQPVRPEPKFFLIDRLYEKGLDTYYQQFFADRGAGWLLGEKSTSYIESEKAARRIVEHFPDARIIMSLRNPVERAISNYWFSFNNGLETLPLEEAIYREDERREDYDHERISASPYAYMQRGRYIDYIQMYQRHVPRENIKVLIYEQLVQDDDAMRDLWAFLGVAADYRPPPEHRERVNAAEKKPTELSDALRQYMRDYFADSNQRLASYLNLDLSQWW